MASLLHLHRLCLAPSKAGSRRLLFRRSFADDAFDPTEKAAKKVQEAAKAVSQKWENGKGSAKSTGRPSKSEANTIKHQAKKENTALDMVKDIPKKTKEAAKGIKDVGVAAAKAVKRDVGKVAEKVVREKKSRD